MTPEAALISTSKPRGQSGLLIPFCAFLLMSGYLLQISQYAVNMPRADDFDMLIGSLLKTLDSATTREVLEVLFSRHGEHYVLVPKLMFIFGYLIFQSINFAFLILIGNIAVPIVALLLLALFRSKSNDRLRAWLPVVLLLSTPAFYQASLWACAVLEHLWIMVIVLAGIVSAHRSAERYQAGRSDRDIPAIAIQLSLSVLALLCQGNGLFLPWTIAILYIWERLFLRSIPFVALGTIEIFMMLGGAEPAGGRVSGSLSLLLGYPFVFLGSCLTSSLPLALTLGLLLVLLNIYVALRARDNRATRALLCLSAFLILTAVANSLARSRFGLAYPLTQARYSYPGLIFVSSTYLALVSGVSSIGVRSRIVNSATLLAAIIWLSSQLMAHPWLELYRNTAKNSAIRWQVAQTDPEHHDPAHATEILKRFTERGGFNPSKVQFPLFDPLPAVADNAGRSVFRGRTHIEHCAIGAQEIHISGYFVPEVEDSELQLEQLILLEENGTRSFAVSIERQLRPDVFANRRRSRLPVALLINSGFATGFKRDSLPAGSYNLALLFRSGNGSLLAKARRKDPCRSIVLNRE